MADTNQFGIEVVFLTGRYVATHYNDRQRPEWPPHPARLFSALVAVWKEDMEGPEDQLEREALEWLENQGPPAIVASESTARRTSAHFVPVNDVDIVAGAWYRNKAKLVYDVADKLHDSLVSSSGEVTRRVAQLDRQLTRLRDVRKQVTKVGKVGETILASANAMLPDRFSRRQERFFPSVTPDSPIVTYVWKNSVPKGSLGSTLDRLLERVTRLGHSSSLVSCRVVTDALPDPNLTPDATGLTSLRNVARGQLAELERQYHRHRGIFPRSLPFVDVRYGRGIEAEASVSHTPNTSGEWILFEFGYRSRAFPGTRTVEVATAMRTAVLHYAADPIPEGLSGHLSDGRPTTLPHVAFLPVPYAGFRHADGRLLGVAVSVPSTVGPDTHDTLYRAIGAWEKYFGGSDFDRSVRVRLSWGAGYWLEMSRIRGVSSTVSLRENVWRRQSRQWVSVIPIALPKHPGNLRKGTVAARRKAWQAAEGGVRIACRHVGLSEPSSVSVSLSPYISGARPSVDFPPFKQSARDGTPVRRQLVHAAVTFDHPVSGPLVLGSGRFLGLGLMRPVFS